MCDHDPFPRFSGVAIVLSCAEISPGVFDLQIARAGHSKGDTVIPNPVAGQFFMLKAIPSGVLLGRPISVYRYTNDVISFLILQKGRGTAELCALRAGDKVHLVGPIGNTFPLPGSDLVVSHLSSMLCPSLAHPRIALVGGGIGVAPVAGFAFELRPQSFDFYAAFRNGVYGLAGLEERASNLVVITESGEEGVKGMLPDAFSPQDYDLVYACGPTPMLRYIQKVCANTTLAFISLEERMACGAGACLGCTIPTIHGNRRCCVDGPVFAAHEVLFDE